MGARQHRVEIVAKRFVGEVGADVDQLHRGYRVAGAWHYAKRGIDCLPSTSVHAALTPLDPS
jgi:hypothetical protein